jgi:predicted RNA binding protein YcfA (HicA-like mRNA interferase family)
LPKLPVVSGKEMAKYLSKKGFEIRQGRGSHVVAKKGGLMTVIPMDDELATGTLLGILEQVGISRETFSEELR